MRLSSQVLRYESWICRGGHGLIRRDLHASLPFCMIFPQISMGGNRRYLYSTEKPF